LALEINDQQVVSRVMEQSLAKLIFERSVSPSRSAIWSGFGTIFFESKPEKTEAQAFDSMALSPFAPMRRLNVDVLFI